LKNHDSKPLEEWENHYFYKFDDEGKIGVYNAAKANGALEDVVQSTNIFVPRVHVFKPPSITSKHPSEFVIECRIIPIACLRYEASKDEIVIMMEKNQYADDSRTFHAFTIESDPISCLESEHYIHLIQ